MTKKKKILLILACVLVVVLNVGILMHRIPADNMAELTMNVQADVTDTVQIYYSTNKQFDENRSSKAAYGGTGREILTFSLDMSSEYLRMDPGTRSGSVCISDIGISYDGVQEKVTAEMLAGAETHELRIVEMVENQTTEVVLKTEGEDPYLLFKVDLGNLRQQSEDNAAQKNLVVNLLIIAGTDICFLILLKNWNKVIALPVELLQNRRMIMSLAQNDFKRKYAGSYLGIIWAFVQPIVTILVYWFVFQVGFRSTEVSDFPFVLYLTTGMVPWFFFQDALNGGTNALIEYNYLVQKVVFKISILPMVKVISAAFVHVFFVCFAMLISALYGYYPTIYVFQLIYYFICTFVFVLGLVYATSAIMVFFRDLFQIISIVLQVGVWMTPIMWDIQMLAGNPLLMKLFRLNPMYYIVNGYRDSMLGRVGISAHLVWTVYFWIVTAALFLLGSIIFKRLKVHFADVL